jgi:hypothetical protein
VIGIDEGTFVLIRGTRIMPLISSTLYQFSTRRSERESPVSRATTKSGLTRRNRPKNLPVDSGHRRRSGRHRSAGR